MQSSQPALKSVRRLRPARRTGGQPQQRLRLATVRDDSDQDGGGDDG